MRLTAALCWSGCPGRPGDRAHLGAGLLGGGCPALRHLGRPALCRCPGRVEPESPGRQPLAPPAHRVLRHRPHADQQRPPADPVPSRHQSEADLFDPCTNIRVGAWLLADSFSRRARRGMPSAPTTRPARNSGTGLRRGPRQYAWRVYRQLPSATQRTLGKTVSTATTVPALMSVRVSP